MRNPKWLEFLESFSEDERALGEEYWKSVQLLYEELGDSELKSTVSDSVYEGIDSILGSHTEDYIKSLLTDYCYDWLNNHGEEDENDSENQKIFYPEDLLRLIYTLTKTIVNQNTTIDNLRFGIEHMKTKEN